MEEVDRLAAHGESEGLRNRLGAHAMKGGFFLVDDEAGLGLVRLDIPVHIDDSGGFLENPNDFFRQGVAGFLVRAVDFGHEGLQDWRAGRDLGEGDSGVVFFGDGGDGGTHALGDVVAGGFAVVAVFEIHLDVGDIRTTAEEVVANESVEVEWRGGAGVNLRVRDFGLLFNDVSHFAGHGGGAFERSSFGHVEDHLKLALVVEGQHFHLHPADADHGHRAEKQKDDADEKSGARALVVQERAHDAAVEPREKILLVRRAAGAVDFAMLGEALLAVAPTEHANRRPGGDDKRNDEREKHRRAGSDRDRTHVGAHEAADKSHRQHCGNHGKGREDGGIPNFTDGLHGDASPGFILVPGQVEMANDVFDNDDGVINENADGKNQRKEGDAVERESEEVKNQKRES